MKNSIIIILICFSINCYSQTEVPVSDFNTGDNNNKYFKDIANNYAYFTGNWENTTGNVTFRVTLWKITRESLVLETNSYMDVIRGHYQIIQDKGTPNEIVLFTSAKNTANGIWPPVMYFRTGTNNAVGGTIMDNNALPAGNIFSGYVRLLITNPGQTPSIANWTLSRKAFPNGLYGDESFRIPTDIIMTKM